MCIYIYIYVCVCVIMYNDVRLILDINYLSVNWDGFNDTESGLWGYTWAAGRSACEHGTVLHNDPHSHMNDPTFWTHSGLERNLALPDGHYYFQVQVSRLKLISGSKANTSGFCVISISHVDKN